MSFETKIEEFKKRSNNNGYFVNYQTLRETIDGINKIIDVEHIDLVHQQDEAFVKSLDEELEKVNDFYSLKKLEFKQILNSIIQDSSSISKDDLSNRVHALLSHISWFQEYSSIQEEGIRKLLNRRDKKLRQTSQLHLVKTKLERSGFVNEQELLEQMKISANALLLGHAKTTKAQSPPDLTNKTTFLISQEEKDVSKILRQYGDYLRERSYNHFGYPYNLDFRYDELSKFLAFSINNLGDPFVESNYGVHSRQFEIEVLNFFADLWKIPRNEYWGYCTTCGTEGNLHGILVGREVLPDGILYASKESHYSVFKAARHYRIPAVPIPTLKNGEINYDILQSELEKNKHLPAILNVNIGTTVKGAVDNLDRIIEILKAAGYTEDRFYIHCDGALFALMLPFVKDATLEVHFEKPISSGQFMGAPMPCGVIIHRRKNMEKFWIDIEYLNSKDSTIMGSRNGQAPLFLWYTLRKKGKEGFKKDVRKCMENAQFLHRYTTMQSLDVHLLARTLQAEGIECMLNDMSNTVVLEKPKEQEFILKWQLACEGDLAHVVVMPNVTQEKIIVFVKEFLESRNRARGL